jgi:excinuclease ABC subunit A
VTFAGTRLQDLVALNIRQAAELIARLQTESVGGLADLEPEARQVAAGILPEIQSRLRFLTDVGLDYLSLDRPTPTLSGGEFQRARLAGCLGSGLIGVCHILDEPTIGLHPHDTSRLLTVLRELRDQGNSVLVVEHDVELMRAADWLIDLGPGAGSEGGQLCASGPVATITGDSPTARALASGGARVGGRHTHEREDGDSCTSPGDNGPASVSFPMLRLTGATRHNLRDCSVEIPLGVLTAVTGVSGSGKTSLVVHTLIPAMKYALQERPRYDPASEERLAIDLSETDLACSELSGFETLERLVIVDQSPLGRSGRACPATHTGVWDEVRKLFAKTRDARLRGFGARRFSFNAKDGRCAECRGRGAQRIEMNFLPDVFVECPACRGTRFNSQTLSIRYRGRSLSDVLRLRVDEAAVFFENIPRLKKVLDVLIEVGLGYVQLGQSALTLSGGEAQRIRLATELSKSGHECCLFVLDEPTTGLHPADVQRLLDVLHRLVEQGHTVLVVEHHTDVISSAGWMIDLGPNGGPSGGQIVATGTPADVAHGPHPGHTAQALARHFQQVASTA